MRHRQRKKISVEKKELEHAICQHNALASDMDKLPTANELLTVDNFSWPWERKKAHM